MSKPSYYDILGIDKKSSDTEIKKAYRSMSLKYHPDRNPNEDANARFQEINEAYETLSDSAKRQTYDMGGQPGGVQFHNMSGQGEFPDINGIFNMMFNGGMGNMGGNPNIRVFHGGIPVNINGRQHRQIRKPEPIVKNIQITLEQSYMGCVVPIEIERWTLSNGTKVNEVETLYVTIPQGIDNNEIIQIVDKGHITPEIKGDIKIGVRVQNDTIFIRTGLDLIYKKTISLKEALCGFSVDFVHINGKKLRLNNMDNPTIIKPGHKNIFKDMGMKREQRTGSLILDLDVSFPDQLTEEQLTSIKTIL